MFQVSSEKTVKFLSEVDVIPSDNSAPCLADEILTLEYNPPAVYNPTLLTAASIGEYKLTLVSPPPPYSIGWCLVCRSSSGPPQRRPRREPDESPQVDAIDVRCSEGSLQRVQSAAGEGCRLPHAERQGTERLDACRELGTCQNGGCCLLPSFRNCAGMILSPVSGRDAAQVGCEDDGRAGCGR